MKVVAKMVVVQEREYDSVRDPGLARVPEQVREQERALGLLLG